EVHGLAVSDDAFTVLLQVGQLTRACTRSQNRMFRRVCLDAVGAVDFNLATFFDFGGTHDHIDFVFLHQKLDALTHAVGYSAATLHDGAAIGFATVYLDAVVGRMVEVLKHLCAFSQRFGRDTAPVEANPAE